MSYIDDIFMRSTLHNFTSYLLGGNTSTSNNEDYYTRLHNAYHLFEQHCKKSISDPCALLDSSNQLLSEYIEVYTEIGIKCGFLLCNEIFQSNRLFNGIVNKQGQKLSLISVDISNALLMLETGDSNSTINAKKILQSVLRKIAEL